MREAVAAGSPDKPEAEWRRFLVQGGFCGITARPVSYGPLQHQRRNAVYDIKCK